MIGPKMTLSLMKKHRQKKTEKKEKKEVLKTNILSVSLGIILRESLTDHLMVGRA